MAVSIPTITIPTPEPAFSTNIQFVTIGGTYDSSATSILVNGSSGGVTLDSSGGWSYSTSLVSGENDFLVQGVNGAQFSGVNRIEIIYDPNIDPSLIAELPSGFQIRQGRNYIKISVAQSTNPNFVGFNYYGAEDPGGGTSGYTLLNKQPVVQIDYFVNNSVVLNKTVTTDSSTSITTTVTQERLTQVNYISYTHNRINQPLGNNPLTEPNSYVATTVIFDPINKKMIESNFSEELSGKPIIIDTQLKEIDTRSEADFRQSIMSQMLQVDTTLDLKPGTVLRDTVIDPNSYQFANMFTLLKFMSTSQSFPTLLRFDSANDTGVSDPVLTSPNKNALRIALLIPEQNASIVQDLIDTAFDKLAGNVNVLRQAAQASIGEVTVYTKRTPTKDAVVQTGAIGETIADTVNGIASVRFQVLSGFTLRVADLPNYFNPTTSRYEFNLQVQAVLVGAAGNVDSNKIVNAVSGFDSVFGIVNSNPTEFGTDKESNSSLATRAQLAFTSVDSGTKAGYFANTISVVGVTRAEIIAAQDPLMQRDLDPIREIHALGKVDIYVQGTEEQTVVDTFGFSFDKVISEPFFIQSRIFFQFKATNVFVDAEHPIYQILEVRNLTRNNVYDLTGATISNDGNVIDLDETNLTNSTIGLGSNDVIRVSYIYRRSDPVQFNTQPVDRIISVTGSKSGPLSEANYQLIRRDDPLLLGRSTDATDAIQFIYANGLPNGLFESVSGEAVVLTGVTPASLSLVNVDDTSIVVHDASNNLYIQNFDYEITPGSNKVPTSIKRIASGTIPNGSTVFVTYQAGEVMTVQYAVNSILTQVNTKIENMRHLTADVVVKSAQSTSIDIEMTVVLKTGADPVVVNRNIRTAIGSFLANAHLGQNVYQSDIISLTEGVNNVQYVVVPLTKMVKSDGVQVIRESLTNPLYTIYQSGTVVSYKSTETLNAATISTGGPGNDFRGIFENDFALSMQANDTLVANAAGQGYITSDGHLIVSTRHGVDPNGNAYTATYIVEGETGAKDIIISGVEYCEIGTMIITFANSGQSFAS